MALTVWLPLPTKSEIVLKLVSVWPICVTPSIFQVTVCTNPLEGTLGVTEKLSVKGAVTVRLVVAGE